MQNALVIGPPELQMNLEKLLDGANQVAWADDLDRALTTLADKEIDRVVIDTRMQAGGAEILLRRLLCELSLTTRVLAIVDELPDGELFAESGVVYLTPPVNISDIQWFICSSSSIQQIA